MLAGSFSLDWFAACTMRMEMLGVWGLRGDDQEHNKYNTNQQLSQLKDSKLCLLTRKQIFRKGIGHTAQFLTDLYYNNIGTRGTGITLPLQAVTYLSWWPITGPHRPKGRDPPAPPGLKEFLQLGIPSFFSHFFFSFELTLLGYASTQSISCIRAFRHTINSSFGLLGLVAKEIGVSICRQIPKNSSSSYGEFLSTEAYCYGQCTSVYSRNVEASCTVVSSETARALCSSRGICPAPVEFDLAQH